MNTKKIILPVLLVLFLATSSSAYFFYKKASALKVDPSARAQEKAQEEVAELVARVGKLIILPIGELPTVATVSDPEKLKGQIFFAKAKMGDKVLLYQNARKAYLYDSVNNKILEVAPINFGDAGKSAQKVSTPAKDDTSTSDTKKKQ